MIKHTIKTHPCRRLTVIGRYIAGGTNAIERVVLQFEVHIFEFMVYGLLI